MIKCNLCGFEEYREKYMMGTVNIVKCKKCGLVCLNPQPSFSEIKKLYYEGYFKGKGFDKGIDYFNGLKYKKGWDHISNSRLKNIEKFVKKGRILDIGCSFGEFLDIARKRGWEVNGVELSKFACKTSRNKFKLNPFNGTLEQAKYPSETFDVITMFEVIEHLPDPLNTLKECNRILKKNGLIIIQTGNVESLSAKIYGKRWPYFLLGHLHYFSKKTISKMLEKAGFKIVKIYNGDEISLSANYKCFWEYKNKRSLINWVKYIKNTGILIIRKLGLGGMSVYGRKR